MENTVVKLDQCMEDIPNQMKIFSLAMRSVYTYEAVSGKSPEIDEFRAIRDQTRNDALVFTEKILPLTVDVVRLIKEYFEYYSLLELEEWEENLSDIIDTASKNQEISTELIELYECIIEPLKQNEDRAKEAAKKLKLEGQKFEDLASSLAIKAEEKWKWGFWLLFVPGLNTIACPILLPLAKATQIKAIATKEQADLCVVNFKIVEQTVIPALKGFINALQQIAGFFPDREAGIERSRRNR